MYLLKLKYPDMVEGLVLINMSAQAEGFMDWAAQKVQKLFFFLLDLHSYEIWKYCIIKLIWRSLYICYNAQILTKAWHFQQITSWTHALPDTVILHLFGKVRTVEYIL